MEEKNAVETRMGDSGSCATSAEDVHRRFESI